MPVAETQTAQDMGSRTAVVQAIDLGCETEAKSLGLDGLDL